jgi:hypothetical protein
MCITNENMIVKKVKNCILKQLVLLFHMYINLYFLKCNRNEPYEEKITK